MFLKISQFSQEKTCIGATFNPDLGVIFRGLPEGGGVEGGGW